jgi:hypothetical protein
MSEEGHIARPVPKIRLLTLTAIGLVVATFILFGAILPAEFNRDPLGLGRATGLDRLWAPPEVAYQPEAGAPVLAREYAAAWRSDTIEIPLRADGDRRRGNDLEYKVRMKKDATLIYSWTVETIENPEEFYYDFHGHTLSPTQESMTVATYKQATGTSANGSLTAPFDGVHGWYFQNQSVNPVVVKVKISGFYELIPCCEAGNEAGIVANVPASEAFGPPIEGASE